MAVSAQLAYHSLKSMGIVHGPPTYDSPPIAGATSPEDHVGVKCAAYSPDGKFFAWADARQVSIIDASNGQPITTLPAAGVDKLAFSPLGTYISTHQRPSKDEEGNATKNLKVWETIDSNPGSEDGYAVVGQFVQKTSLSWNLQYAPDESFCARVVTNEVQFYKPDNLRNVSNNLRVEGVTNFSISPSKNHSVAVFVPERKGQPAAVKIFAVPQFASPISQKTFFGADEVKFKWNSTGSSVILRALVEHDKNNKSYSGLSTLYFLSATSDFSTRISPGAGGQDKIEDVDWSPNGKEFGVIHGLAPHNTKLTIYNTRVVPQRNFDVPYRNAIKFSPRGRFIMIGGFGNIPGHIDIYDVEKDYQSLKKKTDDKDRLIDASRGTRLYEWSPDGQYLLTAITIMNVDRGFNIWHVGGKMLYKGPLAVGDIDHTCWRPQAISELPAEHIGEAPAPHTSAAQYVAPTTVGRYISPGEKRRLQELAASGGNAASSNSVANEYKNYTPGAFSANQNGYGRNRRDTVPGAAPAGPLPPGAAPGGGVSLAGTGEGDDGLSKAALKNKKKREAKKAKEIAEKAQGLSAQGDTAAQGSHSPERRDRQQRNGVKNGNDRRSQSNRRNQSDSRNPSHQRGKPSQNRIITNNDENRAQAPPAPVGITEAPPDLTVTSPGGGSPHEKKVRSLHKKLRAIEDLKMRQAGGEKLEDTQVKKILTEESIRKDLDQLGA